MGTLQVADKQATLHHAATQRNHSQPSSSDRAQPETFATRPPKQLVCHEGLPRVYTCDRPHPQCDPTAATTGGAPSQRQAVAAPEETLLAIDWAEPSRLEIFADGGLFEIPLGGGRLGSGISCVARWVDILYFVFVCLLGWRFGVV